jgi:hypothetical protein
MAACPARVPNPPQAGKAAARQSQRLDSRCCVHLAFSSFLMITDTGTDHRPAPQRDRVSDAR